MFVLFWENRCIQELTHCENNLSLLRNYGRGVLKQALCLNLFKSFTLVKLVKSFLWGPACPGTESLCPSGLYGFHIPLCKYENSSGTLPHSCYPHSSLLYSLSTSDKSTYHAQSVKASSSCPQKHQLVLLWLSCQQHCVGRIMRKENSHPSEFRVWKYQACCSVHTKQYNPFQVSGLCITQAKGLLIVSNRWRFFFF